MMQEMEAHGDETLGMSYELADAHVEDMRAAEWRLTKVTFTGAAILLREKAAYRSTSFRIARETPAVVAAVAEVVRTPRAHGVRVPARVRADRADRADRAVAMRPMPERDGLERRRSA